mmetsp:Transcript_12402/g.15503  ORF Transcript_12402/g.15503 Transcript_12402/m.15503 type:complete len:332 (-) Transcript_12402:545-1540(-)|eukprot:CAMPEP_0172524274 /NCGR_PEP_ID=MMETSP1066-20121228/294101_1 /TAXON_ID=671091 /ORGANISM="Coscinodiscus wailesii, Strain CCMP2513" /LENGTH=331 /DNA_ID=CAMNT_0013307391 /DNA_START=254 /DNA_END=1249 /DNA_ORIENTATION=-
MTDNTPDEETASIRSALSNNWMSRNKNFGLTTPNQHPNVDVPDLTMASPPRPPTRLLADLQRRWNRAVRHLLSVDARHTSSGRENQTSARDDDVTIDKWFDKITSIQSPSLDTARKYHTLRHLEEMFGYIDQLLELNNKNDDDGRCGGSRYDYDDDDVCVLTLSTFFHDAVYVPRSNTNEEDSATLFRQFMSELASAPGAPAAATAKKESRSHASLRERVVRYVLATKRHILATDQEKNDDCLKLFLDVDMSVLGKEDTAYDVYAGLIREEYEFVDREVYCETRAGILERFLESDVFFSKEMKVGLEDRARRNLQREVIMLKAGCIPGHEA